MESIPLADATVGFIWCRGVLVHVADVNGGLVECRRVLCSQAPVLRFQAFATNLLEPQEAKALYDAMSLQTDSMCREHGEQVLTAMCFRIVRSESLGSEFAEYSELQEGRCSRVSLRLARLLRQPDRFVREFGSAAFLTVVGNSHWIVHQLIRKISFRVFLIPKSH
jgi:hypothetical protein